MKRKLIILFVIYLALRLFFSLSTENFSDDKSYFSLRQIEHIKETGKPLIHDSLSYGGRTFVLMPLYYYFMAFFYLFNSIILLKIVQNAMASLILIASYMLTLRLLKNKNIALFCSILISCIPIYLENTINTINPLAVVIPGSVYLIYLFLELNTKLNLLIFLTLLLSITSGTSIFLITSFIAYLILNNIYSRKIEKVEFEYISFFIMFFLWVIFILFKNAFQIHGFGIIYQNIPEGLRENLSLISFITYVGPVFIVLGSYSLYSNLFKEKNSELMIISAILLCMLPLSVFQLISMPYSVALTCICLIILSGNFVKEFFGFIEKSKLMHMKKGFAVLLVILILLQSAFWLISLKIMPYSSSYIAAFKILKEDLPKNSTVISMPKDGNLIAYFGNKKNVMDTDYILADNPQSRYNDLINFYNSKFRINSLRILDKYDAEYFLVYNNSFQLQNDQCFSLIYLGELKIYRKVCEIDE